MTRAKTVWVGLNKSEVSRANYRFKEYAKTYHLNSITDKGLLKDFVYLEILGDRLQEKIQTLGDTGTDVPLELMTEYRDNLERKVKLAEKLGLSSDKLQSNWIEVWDKLKKKAQLYAETHRGACTAKCPYCSKLFLLLMKIDNYESFPFTMFKGTVLYNKKLMELIEEGKLTIEEVSEIWGLSKTDYVKGIYNKIYLVEKSSFNSPD